MSERYLELEKYCDLCKESVLRYAHFHKLTRHDAKVDTVRYHSLTVECFPRAHVFVAFIYGCYRTRPLLFRCQECVNILRERVLELMYK